MGTREYSAGVTGLRLPFSLHLGLLHISGQSDFSVIRVRTGIQEESLGSKSKANPLSQPGLQFAA